MGNICCCSRPANAGSSTIDVTDNEELPTEVPQSPTQQQEETQQPDTLTTTQESPEPQEAQAEPPPPAEPEPPPPPPAEEPPPAAGGEPQPLTLDDPKGAYFEIDPNNKSCIIHWSEKPITGALILARARKTVPEHKFFTNGGKSPLTGGQLGAKDTVIFSAMCSYLKAMKAFDAEIELLPDFDTAASMPAIHFKVSNKVQTVSAAGQKFDLPGVSPEAVCVANRNKNVYQAFSTIDTNTFIGRGTNEGAAMKLE